MSKRDAHAQALRGMMQEPQKVGEYLAANSNLPGPRANLELAHAVWDAAASLKGSSAKSAWDMFMRFTKIPMEDAPPNSRREFLRRKDLHQVHLKTAANQGAQPAFIAGRVQEIA